ncbi:MAG: N-acetyltransferase family protein [Alphaproteobacteria bacterium]
MSEYLFRPAESSDAQALYDFGETLLAESSFLLRSPGERARSADEMRMVIERFAEYPQLLLLNAWRGADVVGEAVVMGGEFIRNRYSGVIGLGVLQAHGGKGLGRELLTRVEDFGRKIPLHRLELTVMAPNDRAKRLYESLGYVAEGVKRDSLYIDGEYVDEIMMAKFLT